MCRHDVPRMIDLGQGLATDREDRLIAPRRQEAAMKMMESVATLFVVVMVVFARSEAESR